MTPELLEAMANIKAAVSQAKVNNSRLKCKKAKEFTEVFIKGAREAYKLAEMKANER